MTELEKIELEKFEEKQISSENIFDGKILHIRKDTVSLPDGNTSFREYIKHLGAVCVIPITNEGEVVCVKQYRYPLHQITLEIPAGKLDSADEDPNEAVVRELREETGAVCSKLTYLGKYFASPAILEECIYMYLAEGLEFGETDFDDDEFLSVCKIPLEEMVEAVSRGEILDGKTQLAVMRVWHMRSQQNK